MKILLMNLDDGGIMHYAVDLGNELVKRNAEVIFYGYRCALEFVDERVKTFIIRNRSFRDALHNLKYVIRMEKPDVIHITGYHIFFVLLCPYIIRKGIPVVFTVHDAKKHISGNDNIIRTIKNLTVYNSLFLKILVRASSCAITLSSYVAGQVNALYKKNSYTIPLGQDVLRYSDYKNNYVNRENSTLKILFFGIVSKYKGINDLLTAAELLYDRKVDFLLTIAGMKVDFEFSIDEKLRNNVKHIDRFVQESEIPSLFSNCDIVVQPYIEVSQSGVAPLSFGFGKPVIVTNIGSFTEIVEDGYNGFLVSPNSPYEIADKLEYLFRNKDVLNNLGKSAKLTYENKISWNKNIDKYINIYKRVGKSSR